MKRLLLTAVLSLAAQTAHAQTMNAERYWTLDVLQNEKICGAAARTAGSSAFMLLAYRGSLSFGVVGPSLPADPKIMVLRLDRQPNRFVAQVNGASIGIKDGPLASSAVLTLKNAQTIAVDIDGSERLSLKLARSGTAKFVDDLLDCSLGKSGWWGEGVQAASDAAARPEAPRSNERSLLPPAPPNAKPGSIPMGPAGSR